MFQRNQPKGQVKIRVIEAKNLKGKDGVFNKTSDPYTIIKVGGQTKKTKIIKQTVDPYWNEEFIMPIFNPNQEMVYFELRDWDLGINRDDLLGTAQFPLSNLVRGVETDLWLAVGGRGQLHVAITALDFGQQPTGQQPMYPQAPVFIPQQPAYPPQQPGFVPPQQPPMHHPPMQQPPMQQPPMQQPPMQQPPQFVPNTGMNTGMGMGGMNTGMGMGMGMNTGMSTGMNTGMGMGGMNTGMNTGMRPTLTTWAKIQTPKYFKYISVGSANNVWACDAHDGIYQYNGFSWNKINGQLCVVAAGADGTVWGVNAQQAIWRYLGNGQWTKVDGQATHISVGNAHNIVCCNAAGKIYRWTGTSWTQLPGQAVKVAIGADGELWCCNSLGKIYRWVGSNWQQIEGEATHIDVGSALDIVVANAKSDNLYKYEHGKWKQIDGKAVCISIGSDGHYWCVNRGGLVYQRK